MDYYSPTDEHLKDAFIEFVAMNVYNNSHDVTYKKVLEYMERNCETLMKSAAEAALKMYTSSREYAEDVGLSKELRKRMEKFTEG